MKLIIKAFIYYIIFIIFICGIILYTNNQVQYITEKATEFCKDEGYDSYRNWQAKFQCIKDDKIINILVNCPLRYWKGCEFENGSRSIINGTN